MKAQYKALILDTVLKEVRSKTLIFIFIATTVALIFGHLILSAMNSEVGQNQGFALVGIDIIAINFRILNSISFFIALIFGVSVFRSDFENNIIYQYLSFPISRTEYFFIRVLGTWLLVFLYYIYAYALSTILFSVAFKSFVFSPTHLLSFGILNLYLLVVIFISILFSLLMNKTGALFITTICCIASAFSYGTFSKLAFNEQFQNLGVFKVVGIFFYYLFPRISFLDELSSSFLVKSEVGANILQQSIHLIIISLVYVYVANYFVKRKDF